jgi:single-strand DNA-binding protein
MSNNISFVGHIGNEPELKKIGENDLLELNVANNVGFGDRRSTNWFRCSIWGKRAVSLQPHLSKGKQVFVTGQLTLRDYTNKEGEKRISPDIRVGEIEFFNTDRSSEQQSSPGNESSSPASAPVPATSTPETKDDMPF